MQNMVIATEPEMKTLTEPRYPDDPTSIDNSLTITKSPSNSPLTTSTKQSGMTLITLHYRGFWEGKRGRTWEILSGPPNVPSHLQ